MGCSRLADEKRRDDEDDDGDGEEWADYESGVEDDEGGAGGGSEQCLGESADGLPMWSRVERFVCDPLEADQRVIVRSRLVVEVVEAEVDD